VCSIIDGARLRDPQQTSGIRFVLRYTAWFALGLLLLSWLGIVASPNSGSGDYAEVAYCDLVRDAARYDGKRVRVSASYRYGFEWQEIYCVTCRDAGKTWLEFPQDPPKGMKRALKGAPKGQGTLNAIFKGVFQAKPGSFGDGGYKFRLVLEYVSAVHVVSRSGGVPDVLTETERHRLCGA
jgi:hypothetical protein